MSIIKMVDQRIWNSETNQWEQIYQSTAAEIVETKDGGNVQEKLDELESSITNAKDDAIAEIQAGVVDEGNTLAKLYSFITALQGLINSDDIDLDTVQEIVNYIKENRNDLTLIGTNKINFTDIENSLLTLDTVQNKVLDARQGRVLKELIDTLENKIINIQTQTEDFVTESELTTRLNTLSKEIKLTVSDSPPDNPVNKQQWLKMIKTISV